MPDTVTIDPDLCIGSGECVRLAPDGFVLDEKAGVSHPLAAAGRLPRERLETIAASCPTGAIALAPADEDRP